MGRTGGGAESRRRQVRARALRGRGPPEAAFRRLERQAPGARWGWAIHRLTPDCLAGFPPPEEQADARVLDRPGDVRRGNEVWAPPRILARSQMIRIQSCATSPCLWALREINRNYAARARRRFREHGSLQQMDASWCHESPHPPSGLSLNRQLRSAGLRPAAAAPCPASTEVRSPIRPSRLLRLIEPRSCATGSWTQCVLKKKLRFP